MKCCICGKEINNLSRGDTVGIDFDEKGNEFIVYCHKECREKEERSMKR